MTPDELNEKILALQPQLTRIEEQLADPAVYADTAKFRNLSRERNHLQSLFALRQSWYKLIEDMRSADELLRTEQDAELRELAEAEIASNKIQAEQKEKELLLALEPPDPDAERNVILEIKPAAGGEEAALFAGELFRAYCKYAELKGWQMSILDRSDSDLGGLKDATLSLSGSGVYLRLKWESGVHRVQRVPVTEAGGRIHTSTVTVSILPEADEQDEIVIRNEDLEISTFRASGPGGQHVNRTDSAVRIHHIPSGIVTASQQERSQLRNREIALRILKSKLLEIQRREEAEKLHASKKAQVGTGDRSERIRTYNFPQNRITDHRFNVSAHNLPALMEGDFDQILDPVFEAAAELAKENTPSV